MECEKTVGVKRLEVNNHFKRQTLVQDKRDVLVGLLERLLMTELISGIVYLLQKHQTSNKKNKTKQFT